MANVTRKATYPARGPLPTGPLTRRALRHYREASAQDIAEGMIWYDDAQQVAHDICEASAGRYSFQQAVDLLAVISPNLRWTKNVQHAWQYSTLHAAGVDRAAWPSLRIGASMRKAERVLDGERGVPSGPKVEAFAANLAGDLSQVTVDVWHTRAIIGKDVPTLRELRAIQRATQNAAAKVGIEPAQLQAIIWVKIRREQA